MGSNPVDFVPSVEWRDAARVESLAASLRAAGFSPTRDFARVARLELEAQAWTNSKAKVLGVLFEDSNNVWVEVVARTRDAREFIASNAAEERVWASGSILIERDADAGVARLLERVESMREGRVLEAPDVAMLAIQLHDRLYQHWCFAHSPSPEASAAAPTDRRARLREWLCAFVAFFRPLGFLAQAAALDDDALVELILEYGDGLISRFDAVEAVCDDFDDLEDIFTHAQLEAMPRGDADCDLRLLAFVESDRVRWEYRDDDAGELAADGRRVLKYHRSAEEAADDPFALPIEVSVPVDAIESLRDERAWLID